MNISDKFPVNRVSGQNTCNTTLTWLMILRVPQSTAHSLDRSLPAPSTLGLTLPVTLDQSGMHRIKVVQSSLPRQVRAGWKLMFVQPSMARVEANIYSYRGCIDGNIIDWYRYSDEKRCELRHRNETHL
jgi:hypothetical protein